ncbi:unnamed protein product [Arabis nemorensis]|uniref:Uncharacterized protein n=1 Tax=Arabis nemorensis TaxID=586526 RepID=A0A565ALR0_9BRAS|nr:unnamed protein product [Arabis nemorensis]
MVPIPCEPFQYMQIAGDLPSKLFTYDHEPSHGKVNVYFRVDKWLHAIDGALDKKQGERLMNSQFGEGELQSSPDTIANSRRKNLIGFSV